MKHARADYDHIQDPSGKIPADEPVFLLRAQDRSAPWAVEEWIKHAEELGAKPDILNLARAHLARMNQWQDDHGSKVADLGRSTQMSNGNEHETGAAAPDPSYVAEVNFVDSRFDRVEILAANIRRDLEEARLLLIEARQALQRGARVDQTAPADPAPGAA